MRFINENQIFEDRGRQKLLSGPHASVQRSYNATANGEKIVGFTKASNMRSTFQKDSPNNSLVRSKNSSCNKTESTYDKFAMPKKHKLEKLINPFFQARGYKIR